MAYDEALAQRIREAMADVPGITEKKMFGGLAFLFNGHMTVAANSRGALMARVDPDRSVGLLGDGVAPMVMRGRSMAGWLDVAGTATESDEQLRRWIDEALEYARTLPPK